RPVVFELINNLDREERVPELARALVRARPNNAGLRDLYRTLEPSGAGKQPRDNSELRRAITNFNQRVQERDPPVPYPNAYKELHDVLHELQSFLPNICDAVGARVTDSGAPLPEDVDFSLRDCLVRAQRNAQDIEFPDHPPGWIVKLETAVDVIAGTDAS